MKEWKNTRNGIIIHEIIVIILVLGILFTGIVIEINSACQFTLSRIQSFDFSIALLQIQATLTTITIAVIALLSGNTDKSYMGISIAPYCISVRPVVFKIRGIIVLEFICLGTAILSCINGHTYMLLSIFIVDVVLILVSVFEIMIIFKGKRYIFEEIESYLTWLFETGDNYISSGQLFVEEWKERAITQSLEEYDKWKELFFKLIIRMISKEEDIDSVNSFAEKIGGFLLDSDVQVCKKRGLDFIFSFYGTIDRWLSFNCELLKNTKKQIHLIDRLYYKWCDAAFSVDISDFEKYSNWDNMSRCVLRVSARIGNNEKTSASERNAISGIAKSLGDIIKNTIDDGNDFNTKYWEALLFRYYDYELGYLRIPDESIDFYMESLAIRDLSTCYGYIIGGFIDMLNHALIVDDIGHLHDFESKYYVIRTMMIHCLMYYMAFRVNPEDATKPNNNSLVNILTDSKTIESIMHFYMLLRGKDGLLSANLEGKMETYLKDYQIYPDNENEIIEPIRDSIRDYYLYVVLMLRSSVRQRESLSVLLDYNTYYPYLLECQNWRQLRENQDNKNIYYRFKTLERLFRDGSHSYSVISVDEMLDIFEQVMQKKHKNTVIRDAMLRNVEYQFKDVETTIMDSIKHGITDGFMSVGDPELFDKDKTIEKTVNVLTVKGLQKNWLIDKDAINTIDLIIDHSLFNFKDWLLSELTGRYGIKTIDRGLDYNDDMNYLEFLSTNKFDLFVGAEDIFEPDSVELFGKYGVFYMEKDHNYSPYYNYGIATNKGDFLLTSDDVLVNIRTPQIEDVDFEFREETGKYMYRIYGANVEFEEQELQDYLRESEIVVDVSMRVTIGLNLNEERSNYVVIKRDY